ncbi:MAG: hypothetical protein RIR11_2530 [Bacteroidota bacterium]|jgi:hypothetical protein
MQLIIESNDEKIFEAIVEFIRPFNLTFRQVDDTILQEKPLQYPLEKSRREGIRQVLHLIRNGQQTNVSKIEIPSREERNER